MVNSRCFLLLGLSWGRLQFCWQTKPNISGPADFSSSLCSNHQQLFYDARYTQEAGFAAWLLDSRVEIFISQLVFMGPQHNQAAIPLSAQMGT